MGKKVKCNCPKPGLTAPFYLLTYGDLMTLLLCFFVLLFSMATIESTKFQSQIAIMKGSLGISKLYRHTPMQENLPSPAVKQSNKVQAKSKVTPKKQSTTSDSRSTESFGPEYGRNKSTLQAIKALGINGNLNVSQQKDNVILLLPTYGIFGKGEYEIDPNNPEVQRIKPLFSDLAAQIKSLSQYDISFVGHTDSLPLRPSNKPNTPKDNMELGFLRAVNLYNFFFKDQLTDITRITFGSQGDNVPVIPNALLDSERRKNRRVQIHLKKHPS